MVSNQSEILTKLDSTQKFTKLFEIQPNSKCFSCSKQSKQWAEINHGIFLCLKCSSFYKQISKSVEVKSIALESWKQQQIKLLEAGGNKRFKQFLESYNFDNDAKIFLRSQAVEYYRRWLNSQVTGEVIGEKPSVEEGKKPFLFDIPITQMTTDQMLSQAKQRLSWAGEKTVYYGNKAFEKVHHKITSGQLKQDMKNVADTVSKKAKSFWSFITSSRQQKQKPQNK